MADGAARMARDDGGGAEVATAAWLSDGEGKSERGRAREWEWERVAATPNFTPSIGQTDWPDASERPPRGARGLAAIGHAMIGWPIQISRQAN